MPSEPMSGVEQVEACPFCGGEPATYKGQYCSSVKCDNGHAIHVYAPTIEEAITAWNTRALPQSQAPGADVERACALLSEATGREITATSPINDTVLTCNALSAALASPSPVAEAVERTPTDDDMLLGRLAEMILEVENTGSCKLIDNDYGDLVDIHSKLATLRTLDAGKPAEGEGWHENVTFLLEKCPHTVRCCEGGATESLIGSLTLTFVKMQQMLAKTSPSTDDDGLAKAVEARVDEDHPLLAPILTLRRKAAANFNPEFMGSQGAAYDRAILDCYRAIEATLKARKGDAA